MATEVFDDAIDLQIGLIHAGEASIAARGPAYPYPLLTPTGDEEMRRFRTIVLENPYLRVVVVPALGGRIVSLFDKRTSTEILQRYPAVLPQPCGPRGASVREGIQLRFGADDRLNSLGNVDTANEDEAVWIAESAAGSPLSFHLRVSLHPEAAIIELEARVFNRTLRPASYNGGFAFHVGDGEMTALPDGIGFYGPRDTGLVASWPGQEFGGVDHSGGTLSVARWSEEGALAPRQLDTFRMNLLPISGLGGLSTASEYGALAVGEEFVRVQATRELLGHKLLLATEEGRTLEAPMDLYPEHVVEIPLSGLRPTTLVLRSPGQEDLIRWDTSPARPPADPSRPPMVETTVSRQSTLTELRRATMDVSQRALAHTLVGYRFLGEGDYAQASAAFEQALLFNAEDHLTWWAKAVAERLAGNAEGERPELLNAHYLAPLEPALRAEAFLSQSETGAGASPIVEPLAENPENLIEVAALLIEAGLLAEANRWIEEALRHRDLAMLHLLQAYALSRGTRMAVEAAQHLRAASDLSQPPLPYREIEWEAIDQVRG